jgi:hypothetical protein
MTAFHGNLAWENPDDRNPDGLHKRLTSWQTAPAGERGREASDIEPAAQIPCTWQISPDGSPSTPSRLPIWLAKALQGYSEIIRS